ncbi:ABC transporter permease [Priestia sp. RMT2NF4]|uniref:YhgE/Pip domain-containing protein n=1 Tax=Priestia sp. RMT2NF4 TaxID=3398394 RepID=UPI003A4C6D29
MKLSNQKLIYLSPIIVVAVIFIFTLTLIPSVSQAPKNLPIAFVNADEGMTVPAKGKVNIGDHIKQNMKSSSAEQASVKWIFVSTTKEVETGLNNQKYYGALIIPKDFTKKQATLQTAQPEAPAIRLLVNQGMNTAASTLASQVLNGAVDQMNENMRLQLVKRFEQSGTQLSANQALALATPIQKTVINVNKTGTHSVNGNAPVSLFQPLWMASIAGAAVVFLSIHKITFSSRKEKIVNQIGFVIIGATLALAAGFGLAWLAEVVGISVPSFLDTALFLAIAYFSFFTLISAALSWLGLKGLPIFVIILFFGAPLLPMAPEIMPDFYREWIYPWLPMRFMVDGVRELFFFGEHLTWNHSVSALALISLISLCALFASALPASSVKKEKSRSI